MQTKHNPRVLLAIAFAAVTTAPHFAVAAESASRLRAQYEAVHPRLKDNDFGRPMVLQSAESPREVRGEIYALFDHPFERVKTALDEAGEWCDVLLLPINSKFCRTAADGSATTLNLGIGKMNDPSADNAQVVALAFRPPVATAEHFAAHLQADAGPVGTSDYRIRVEAIPIDGKRTFLHFTYSYSYGMAAKLAMQAYLGTSGRSKVGFTILGQGPSGEPEYVGGMRGVIERNVMRYYLAIEAALHASAFPAQQRLEQRLHRWFTATEAYPRQLREISRSQYLSLKLGEPRRQAASVLSPGFVARLPIVVAEPLHRKSVEIGARREANRSQVGHLARIRDNVWRRFSTSFALRISDSGR